MSNCSKCNSACDTNDCGCTPVGLTTPNYCITDTPVCPDPAPCSEITDAECLIYTGPDILCQGTPVILQNDSIASAFVALASLACATASGGVQQIIAGNNIVISPSNGLGIVTINADCCDVYFADIIGDAYSNTNLAGHLNLKQDILTAGAGISIVGTTISAVGGLGTVTNVSTVFTQTGSSPSLAVANPTTTPVITLNLPLASGTASSGLLSSANWTTFNNKQNAITLTTVGTTGASTWNPTTAILNIPVYQGQLTLNTTGTGAATLVGNTLTIPTNTSPALSIGDGTTTVNGVTSIQFVGAVVSGTTPAGVVTVSPATAGGYTTIQKTTGGVPTSFTQRAKLNFIGSSVSIVDNPGAVSTDVTIQAYKTIQDGNNNNPITSSDTIIFTGAGVTVTGTGLATTVTIPGAVLPVNRTVYVMKNGSDVSGLVQRLDKPFLTIGAARTAALAYWTGGNSPTETNRIKIVVETGSYTEDIVIHDFIDYDLQDSTITAATAACIIDKGSAYTLTTKGRYTSMIYGNASFVSGNGTTCLLISSLYSQNINLYIQCNNLANIVSGAGGSAAKIYTGKVTIDAQYIYSSNLENQDAVVLLGSDTAYNISSTPYPPKVEIFNAKIYNNQSVINAGAPPINNTIGVKNGVLGSSGYLGTAYPVKLTLKNCEIANFNSGSLVSAIGVYSTDGGILDVTLKNTSIYQYPYAGIHSISDTYLFPAVGSTGLVKVWCQGAYSNIGLSVTGGSPQTTSTLQTYSVDAALQFNQGIIIP